MAQPLPSQLPEYLSHSDKISETRSAYSKILLLEKAAADAHRQVCEKRLIHARILGYLSREGPSIRASEHVAKEVNSCKDNNQMDKIGETCYLHFICPCEPPSLNGLHPNHLTRGTPHSTTGWDSGNLVYSVTGGHEKSGLRVPPDC
jgi:hypothetical protein